MGFWSNNSLLALAIITSIILSNPHTSSSSSASDETQQYYQVFNIKNTPPFFLNDAVKYRHHIRPRHFKNKNKMINGNHDGSRRVFSTMLPKGFVPPSGSSQCHNDVPNSLSFLCRQSRRFAADKP